MLRGNLLRIIAGSLNRGRNSRRFSVSDSQSTLCETLESRTLLSGPSIFNPGIHLDAGTISVIGTSADDTIRISEKRGTLTIRALGRKVNYDMNTEGIARIVVMGHGGADKALVSSTSATIQILGGSGADYLTGSGDLDIDGEDGHDVIRVNLKSNLPVRIRGGQGDDMIRFASKHESSVSISGGEGHDAIRSKSVYGTTIDGGPGNDSISGGKGDDTISGGDGDDTITGTGGRDLLFGDNGNDVIRTKKGHAILVGGAGNDVLHAGNSGGVLIGGTGTDKLTGGKSSDVLVDGVTSFDGNMSMLTQIVDAWLSQDLYSGRIQAVSGLLNGSTVTHDASEDLINGAKAHDLFFAGMHRDLLDTEACETVIDADAANEPGKHLFILSGQSNMERHRPEEAFNPTVKAALGADQVIVVQDAMGGQPIQRWYQDWMSPSGSKPKSTGDLYQRLMCRITSATAGHDLESVTFIWMQGERDAKLKLGDVYEASLEGLYGQLSEDIGRDDVNFVIGRLSDFDLANRSYPHWTMIRDIQVGMAESDQRFDWVNTDDLNDRSNGTNDLHYTARGYRTLGERFAEKALSLIDD